eukprot:GEMP01112860.1.p1 GENE.GEMP01112860.1~~GEMP01112860.1.p1  ORF type:complete len:199 (+),score=3.20 GEMP01112860.1:33-629(+)
MPNNITYVNYSTFKEIAKLLLKTKTEFPETYIRKSDTEYPCPTCDYIGHSKSRLTLHRKNSRTCINQFIAELNALHICPGENCDAILKTQRDLEKHLAYHCQNNETPFTSHQDSGEIDRRTFHGFGIPKKQIKAFKEKAQYNIEDERWKCLICDFSANKFNWCRVFGHIASKHRETEKIDDSDYLRIQPEKEKYQTMQ